MAKRIYLMADMESSSLWTDEPFHCGIDLEDLPLSDRTKEGLRAWSAACWNALDAEMGNGPPFDDAAHHAEGVRLWGVVRAELGPEYEVGFATADEDPYDKLAAIKRIAWDPEENLELRPGPPPAEAAKALARAEQELIEFCARRQAELVDDRALQLAFREHGQGLGFSDEITVSPAELMLVLTAALRGLFWATTADSSLDGELTRIVGWMGAELDDRHRGMLVKELADLLARGAPPAAQRESWEQILADLRKPTA